jgi:hypothetical protein
MLCGGYSTLYDMFRQLHRNFPVIHKDSFRVLIRQMYLSNNIESERVYYIQEKEVIKNELLNTIFYIYKLG